MRAKKLNDQLRDMPGLYFERTSPQEQARHREKLSRLAAEGGLLVDPIRDRDGGWHVELVTMDWDEPGLLDNIFEAILRSIQIPKGVAIRRARIFTGMGGQVVNILELATSAGEPVQEEACRMLMKELSGLRPGERGALESIEHLPFTDLIPFLTEFPVIDNDSSSEYTLLRFRAEKLSNRFTSVLLHFLARSELWLNIQIAEFVQDGGAAYHFYVVDKYGRKLRDSHYTRLSIVRVLEAMNRMMMRFNVQYIRRDWYERIQRREKTIYHSRPDPEDFMRDLESIRQLADLKGLTRRLSPVVDQGLLDSKSFYFLKKVESFVEHNGPRISRLVESGPGAEDIELCREYFELRRRALRIMTPLFERLAEMPEASPKPSDTQRLKALCRPSPTGAYALDHQNALYHTEAIWLREPLQALDPFVLAARTDSYIRDDFMDAIEASLESWTPEFVEENLQPLGKKFLQLLDESVRQGNTATILRNLRSVGLLQRYLPGFEAIQGLIHVISDHAYTVDEHSFIVIEVLEGLQLLGEVLPDPGKTMMRREYEKLEDAVGLQKFARKFVMEMRMLENVTELQRNPAVHPFFRLMDEVRRNSLEFLVEMNFLDQGYSICMGALVEIEKIRMQLDPLVHLYSALSFAEQRNLVLSGLLHDLKKPAREHGEMMAEVMSGYMKSIGLKLPGAEVKRIAWLVRHHLDIRPVMGRMGSEGEQALLQFAQAAPDTALVKSLILFTYADRVAVYLDQNKNSHDAMVLSQMLAILERAQPPPRRKARGSRARN
ncbi:MAG: HD domain-containing protein [SAR324 cluster bacterium]|nr:HD domain-containing protein [SAR324 cluster bacterium]